MNRALPGGTRDILPAEMRELRRLQNLLIGVFEEFGYGEVVTPTIEYLEVLAHGDVKGAPSAYSFFDEGGDLLALRSDMTVPIARLASTRMADVPLPWRLFYIGNAYRSVRAQRGQMREFMQAGIEFIGGDVVEGNTEMIAVLDAALERAGLPRAIIGVGDASLYPTLLDGYGIAGDVRERLIGLLAAHDFAGLEAAVRDLDLDARAREALIRIPGLRGGAGVFGEAEALGGAAATTAAAGLVTTFEALRLRGIGDRVRFDLGLVRELGYYTGVTVEVYEPTLGHVLGGGGRYDNLFARFGRDLPAAGFALHVERLHIARSEEGVA